MTVVLFLDLNQKNQRVLNPDKRISSFTRSNFASVTRSNTSDSSCISGFESKESKGFEPR